MKSNIEKIKAEKDRKKEWKVERKEAADRNLHTATTETNMQFHWQLRYSRDQRHLRNMHHGKSRA
jgi:hypothetical protein